MGGVRIMRNLGDHLSNMSAEKRLYILEALPTHLADVGQLDRLYNILSNFGFMEFKASVLGLQPLIEDYNLSNNSDLRIVQELLQQQTHILTHNPEILISHLYTLLLLFEEETGPAGALR